MKSFSSTSFANAPAEVLESALDAVRQNPQALFTDFQWFLFEGRDTVFYTAFSKKNFDKNDVINLVAEMVNLAPQLTHGFVGAKPGQPFPKHLLDAITSVEEVDSFDGYPDKWLSKSGDIFDHPDLPLFRVMVAVRRDGPDAEGRRSLVQVRSSHALLEGSDSALLTRSANAAHGTMSNRAKSLGTGAKWSARFGAWSMTIMMLVLANLFAAKELDWGFKVLAIKRHRLRLLANRLGVGQRSLMFALVAYALNGEGPDKHMAKKVIGAAYTMLDAKRHDADDDFFRVRALAAKFAVKENFLDFVREVDGVMRAIEQKDITKFQMVINGMFHNLRLLNKLTKRLPGKRFWRFSGGTELVLTLVPPHRTYGPLTEGVMEPIYCGAWHSAANIATFCPGRDYVTMSFSMEQRHIDNVDKIMALLERVETMELPVAA